jgi:hypothetical protein
MSDDDEVKGYKTISYRGQKSREELDDPRPMDGEVTVLFRCSSMSGSVISRCANGRVYRAYVLARI